MYVGYFTDGFWTLWVTKHDAYQKVTRSNAPFCQAPPAHIYKILEENVNLTQQEKELISTIRSSYSALITEDHVDTNVTVIQDNIIKVFVSFYEF